MSAILDRLQDQRRVELDAVDRITDAAEAEDRDLTDTDRAVIGQHHSRIDELDPQIELEMETETRRAKHYERLPARRVERPDATEDPPAAPAYRTFAQHARDVMITRFDYIAQAAGGHMARQAAEERLSRAVADTTTTTVAGLMPPQYLTQIMTVIDASRPIVDSARRVGLTSGQLTYPNITQKPTVGKQTAQKTEGPSQAMQVAFVNVTADTYTGVGDLSWQALNWTTPDALTLWFDLAAEAYAIQTEAASGTVLAAATAMATPAIPATPTLADWTAAITAAAGVVYTASRRHPDTVYADIATGYSIIGLVSNTQTIFINAGNFDLRTGQGNVAGLRLVISAGLPAKTVVVGASQSLLAAETAGAPVELRAVEPALGGLQVGVIGAFVSKITDAGAFRRLTVT